MADDIVTRLRNEFEFYTHAQEAADEIERLRAQASTWRRVADHLAIALQVQIGFSELTYTGQGALDHYEAVCRGI